MAASHISPRTIAAAACTIASSTPSIIKRPSNASLSPGKRYRRLSLALLLWRHVEYGRPQSYRRMQPGPPSVIRHRWRAHPWRHGPTIKQQRKPDACCSKPVKSHLVCSTSSILNINKAWVRPSDLLEIAVTYVQLCRHTFRTPSFFCPQKSPWQPPKVNVDDQPVRLWRHRYTK